MFGSIAGFILASTYVTDSLLFAFPVDCFCLTHDVGIHYFLALRTTYCIVVQFLFDAPVRTLAMLEVIGLFALKMLSPGG